MKNLAANSIRQGQSLPKRPIIPEFSHISGIIHFVKISNAVVFYDIASIFGQNVWWKENNSLNLQPSMACGLRLITNETIDNLVIIT